ncbi:glycerophosphoryl diester phosphodiesterase [Alicyclobacillus hesperidum subsp. aegles]|uniref:glycerophosphodiester phosphodiesterase n=1 Tax=Alicyclobacillus hesperidum TaxID=89784 RepID=UPI00222D6F71|nr:glycerophosphodiester phosphodiesterase family protein [Alicyclobacillus hesperidum]GLG02473.1 glycerophosphoryl diester phosphodiesterase [Alicyclobacillus hesperidum subsp. aegles]
MNIQEWLQADDVVWIAHRGAKSECPENTLPAFTRAVAMGADMIELDVRSAGDGSLIVLHDATLERTTNGQGAVSDMTLAQIRQYDAGAWFDQRFQGTVIPTLDEVLVTLPHTCLNIELKTGPAERTHALVRSVLGCIYRHGAAGRVLLSSFDHTALAAVRSLDPTIALGALFVGRLWPPFDLAETLRLDSLHPDVEHLDPHFVAQAKARGYAVFAWTVRSKEALALCLQAGVSGVILDDLTYKQTASSSV